MSAPVRRFRSLLVANRGEIACRVIDSARALGLETVAVYAPADAGARHVLLADRAVALPGSTVPESYGSGEAVLDAARAAGAEAIHPGYGFLAENAAFAEACAEADLVFVGPDAATIALMGDKRHARARMQAAGVPVVPGFDEAETEDDAAVLAAIERVGCPVLLKASAGGGGKGMRIVAPGDDATAAIGAARREARSAFGSGLLLVERYVERGRHVEVQLLGDAHGRIVHLFERDCSTQRRYQKVVEEAPAPALDPAVRTRLHEAALEVGRSTAYRGAGTVEFLVAGPEVYFLEMNTRLQVEHPVTEAVTGVDLVAWQLRIAMGAPIPDDLVPAAPAGHAIEARLYAEDPRAGFLPQTGTIRELAWPEPFVLGRPDRERLRVDAGVRAGDAISALYDPMIAKLTAWGPDRDGARTRLVDALARLRYRGPRNNVELLRRVLEAQAFREPALHTRWLEAQLDAPGETVAEALPFAVAAALALDRAPAAAMPPARGASPFQLGDHFRVDGLADRLVMLREGDGTVPVRLRLGRGGALHARVGALEWHGTARRDGERLLLHADDAELAQGFAVTIEGAIVSVRQGRSERRFERAPEPGSRAAAAAPGSLAAPMTGTVLEVLVAEGDAVAAGQTLAVLEAMKMEHRVLAPRDGVVASCAVRAGASVQEGQVLFALAGEDPRAGARNRVPP